MRLPLLAVFGTSSLLIGLARGCNFLLYSIITYHHGFNEGTDSLLFSLGITTAISMVVTVPIENSLIPAYARARESDAHLDALIRMIKVLGLGVMIISGLLALFSPAILARLTAFTGPQLIDVKSYLLLLVPCHIAQYCTSVLRAVAITESQYIISAAASLAETAASLLVATTTIFTFGLKAMPIALMTGGVVGFLALLLATRRSPFAERFRHNPANIDATSLRDTKNLIAAQIIGTAIVSTGPVIDQCFASHLGPSVISAYALASRVFMVPVTLCVSSIFPFFLSTISRAHAEGRNSDVKRITRKALLFTSVTCALLTPTVIIFREPLTYVCLLGRGHETAQVSAILWILVLSLVPYVAGGFLTRVHLAFGSSSTLMWCAVLIFLTNLILDSVLVRALGINGIALSTVLVQTAAALFLMIKLKRHSLWNRRSE